MINKVYHKYGKGLEEKIKYIMKRTHTKLINKKIPMKFILNAIIYAIDSRHFTFTCRSLLVIYIWVSASSSAIFDHFSRCILIVLHNIWSLKAKINAGH